jgi:hypothetical protein
VGTYITVSTSPDRTYGLPVSSFEEKILVHSHDAHHHAATSGTDCSQYIVFRDLDMLNSFWPLLLAVSGDIIFIFMIVQFIRGIPIDLDRRL